MNHSINFFMSFFTHYKPFLCPLPLLNSVWRFLFQISLVSCVILGWGYREQKLITLIKYIVFLIACFNKLLVLFWYMARVHGSSALTNEPPYDEVLGITNDILRPSSSKMYGKEPRYKETSSKRTYLFFGSSLALRYVEVSLYLTHWYSTN